jgi:hypothetical protein
MAQKISFLDGSENRIFIVIEVINLRHLTFPTMPTSGVNKYKTSTNKINTGV